MRVGWRGRLSGAHCGEKLYGNRSKWWFDGEPITEMGLLHRVRTWEGKMSEDAHGPWWKIEPSVAYDQAMNGALASGEHG